MQRRPAQRKDATSLFGGVCVVCGDHSARYSCAWCGHRTICRDCGAERRECGHIEVALLTWAWEQVSERGRILLYTAWGKDLAVVDVIVREAVDHYSRE